MAKILTDGKALPLWLADLLPDNVLVVGDYSPRDELLAPDLVTPGTVLVCGSGQENAFVSYCERHAYPYGVVVLGDENLENFMGYLSSKLCRFAVRQYFHPMVYKNAVDADCQDKLLVIRLSCSDSFFQSLSSAALLPSKDLIWSFAGQMKPTRWQAIQEFHKLPGGFLLDTDQGFLSDVDKVKALVASDYCSLLRRSYFALCPAGWVNLDTQRVYEALDAGAIPIVLANAAHGKSSSIYWSHVFPSKPPAPFVVAPTWPDARQICQELIDSGELDSRVSLCAEYWKQAKQYWRDRLRSFFRLMD